MADRAALNRSDRLNDRSSSNACRAASSLLTLVFIISLLTVIVPRAGANLPRSTCRGVRVSPDRNLQALINARPRGTTFCFAKGLYRLSSQIWTGDKFPRLDLRAGAVIDGQNGGFTGINGSDPPADKPGTTILGGVFQHFGNADAEGAAPVVVRRNGVVVGTEFRENFNVGLGVNGSNARVSNVYTHHNGRYGLVVTEPCAGCPGPVGVIVEDSEIAFNNTRMLPTDYDAGGTKFSAGTGMIVRRNRVHDNYGSGLWWDGYNGNARVYGNVIYDNRNWGIMYELSLGGTRIHDNTLTGNGFDGSADWSNNVQLLVASSDGSVGGNRGIEIYQNRISGSAYPLAIITQGGRPATKKVSVHHNVLTLRASTSRVGAYDGGGTGEIFSEAANNRFDHNTYRVPDRGAYWAWDGQTLTWSQWQAAGNDVQGIRRQAG